MPFFLVEIFVMFYFAMKYTLMRVFLPHFVQTTSQIFLFFLQFVGLILYWYMGPLYLTNVTIEMIIFPRFVIAFPFLYVFSDLITSLLAVALAKAARYDEVHHEVATVLFEIIRVGFLWIYIMAITESIRPLY